MFEQVKTVFLKNLIHDVWLIKKQVQSIEPGRASLKILNLGNLGFNSCFWKSYHHILMHFCSSISMLWVVPKFFSKTMFFFFLKFSEPLPVLIDPIYFSINRNSFKLSKEASVCFDWSKLFFNRSKLFWNCFKIF